MLTNKTSSALDRFFGNLPDPKSKTRDYKPKTKFYVRQPKQYVHPRMEVASHGI